MKVLHEYDAKLDSRGRLTLRSSDCECYHVSIQNDGTIILKPRESTTPFMVSAKTLSMMDNSVLNIKKGIVSEVINNREN